MSIDLESGLRIEIEGVLLAALNGSDVSSLNAHIRAYSSPAVLCASEQPDELTFRLDQLEVQGSIHSDSVDEDFHSDVVLHVHLNDPMLLTDCGLAQPFDLSIRLQTDASHVDDRIAPTPHACKDH
jgi:hypothetical protein